MTRSVPLVIEYLILGVLLLLKIIQVFEDKVLRDIVKKVLLKKFDFVIQFLQL
jgi:hypothetical protein